jgi:very-short-patch-repair endonuclease
MFKLVGVTTSGVCVEVDFAWPAHRVALEVSPFFAHGTRATQERDMERCRLLTQDGWRTIEATDPDLVDRATFQATTRALHVIMPALQLPFDQAG